MTQRKLVVLALLMVPIFGIQAQKLALFSTQSTFQTQTAQFNSAVHNTSRDEALAGGIFSSGLFRDFRKYYASGVLTSADSLSRHGLGVVALQDQRGELISETRFEGLYRVYIPIREETYLGMGCHLGLYQMGLEASTTTAGDNDMNFNMNLSGGIFNDRWSISAYVTSLNSPTFQILNTEVPISKVFGLYASVRLYDLTPLKSKLTIHSTRILDELFVIGSFDQVYREDYLFGLQLGNNAVGTYIGLTHLGVGPRQLSFSVGYQYSYEVREVSDVNRIQLMLSVF